MAEAKRIEEVVVKVITLELTMEEAQALAAVLSKVGGSVSHTRRGKTNDIECALLAAGVKSVTYDLEGEMRFNRNGLPAGDVW